MSRASDLANLIASGSTTIFGEAGVTSSGSTGKTTNLQQGLAKVWVHFDATSGTPAVQDSFNEDSITDGGVGNFTINFTNNMNNDDFSVSVGGGSSGASNRNASVDGIASSSVSQLAYNNSNSQIDMLFNFTSVHGDLA